LGVQYLETRDGTTDQDDAADQFTVTFTGGASGTTLTSLVISTDKDLDGVCDAGDVFFDTAMSSPGVYNYWAVSIISAAGIDARSVHCTVADGGMTLTLTFDEGFEAGDVLVFGIDVDEAGILGANAIVEGAEFEGAYLAATFEADHYETVTITNVAGRSDTTSADYNRFLDAYDSRLAVTSLEMSADNSNELSAAAIVTAQQELLPITLSGTVYQDADLDRVMNSGEAGISGVTMTLYELEDEAYLLIATTTTAADGMYSFSIAEEGTYKVVEMQPSGYFSTGAEIGTVNGQDRGDVYDENTLDRITIEGGDDSIHNNFGEAKEVSISGYVYHDLDNNGVMDSGEKGIEGAKITLVYNGSLSQDNVTVVTGSGGSWSATGLAPGTYTVIETQPGGYFDSDDSAGTVDGETRGTAVNPGDEIDCVWITSGESGVNYNFGEAKGSLSGYVYVDINYSETYEAGTDTSLSGISVHLIESGMVIATTYTDVNGSYHFSGFGPGDYTIQRGDVGSYIDAADQIGSQGGTLDPPDAIANIVLDTADTRKGTDYNFSVIASATISGYVYASQSNTGEHADGDAGIAGVTITLYSKDLSNEVAEWNQVATTTTDANGYYEFTGLVTGLNTMFKVVESQPTGWLQGISIAGTIDGETQGTEDGSDEITDIAGLLQNTSGVNFDFTEIRPVAISGYVFQDGAIITYASTGTAPDIYKLRDGKLTSDDTRLAGVTLVLADGSGALYYDGNGDPIITTTTDANGYYQFTGLLPDSYTIIQLAIAGYTNFIDTPGSNAGVGALWVNKEIAVSLTSAQLWSTYGLSTVPEGNAIAHIDASTPGTTIAQNNFSVVLIRKSSAADIVAVGTDAGSASTPQVKVYNSSGTLLTQFMAYETTFRGGVRVAVGDVTGDGIADIVTTPGSGRAAQVRVYQGSYDAKGNYTVTLKTSFVAIASTFTGGLSVAIGDVNGDGRQDVVVGGGTGSQVQVYNGKTLLTTHTLVGSTVTTMETTFRGGVTVAAGDVNNDGKAEVVVGRGSGGATTVKVYRWTGTALSLGRSFNAFSATFTYGVNVAVGDYNGDGTSDIICGAGAGNLPTVTVYSGVNLLTTSSAIKQLASFQAYDSTYRGGVRVAVKSISGTSKVAIWMSPGVNTPARKIRTATWTGTNLSPTLVDRALASIYGTFIG
jgi:5-hydroxyisourate hydrolase-like protein (transthyretin family)